MTECQKLCLDKYAAEVHEHWRRFLNGEIDAATREALLAKSLETFNLCVENCNGNPQ